MHLIFENPMIMENPLTERSKSINLPLHPSIMEQNIGVISTVQRYHELYPPWWMTVMNPGEEGVGDALYLLFPPPDLTI